MRIWELKDSKNKFKLGFHEVIHLLVKKTDGRILFNGDSLVGSRSRRSTRHVMFADSGSIDV